jgi:hypothetical protein
VSAAGAVRAVVAALGLVTAGSPVLAHTGGSTGHASLAVDGAAIRYSLTLWPATLPPAVAETLRLARGGDASSRDGLLAAVRDKVALTAHGQRCLGGAGSLLPARAAGPAAPGARSESPEGRSESPERRSESPEGRSESPEGITLVVEFRCAAVVRELAIRDDLFDVLGPDYHTLARIDGLGRSQILAFAPEAREARVSREAAPGGLRALAHFVPLGVEHILTGWDHLLFLLALLLPGGGWRAVLKIITAFTLAHSVTLGLAVLDVVALPERLIESVIALSIAAVAVENLYIRPTVTRRWIVSLGFGLVHGFGFSSVLREVGLPADGLLLALFGFNAGVELGQALVVAVALPAMAALRRAGWERRMVRGSSMAIMVVGLALFVERLL